MYFYYQVMGGSEFWQEALAEGRQQLIATKQPRFTTVLDLSALITDSTTREDLAAIRYVGPAFFDFDSADLQTVLPKFQQFLGKLQAMDVDLAACRLFATGVKGFHIEIPQEHFLAKPPKGGIQHLPLIYRELAFTLYVDTLDLRVFSGRKGRMWRTPNVLRENGTSYKVPLTVEEALKMKPEDYAGLCAAPRSAPALAKAELNQRLAVEFAKAEQKVVGAFKRRKDSSKDLELLARFKGEFPPSLQKVMAGETLCQGGFQQVAMQIAISANAIGKKEEDVIALCEGLVQNHVSDGTRYNTPVKRRAELSRMLQYTEGNLCYAYSRSAVRALLPKDTAAPDLDGLPASAGAITGLSDNDDGLLQGVFMTEAGIYRRGEDGALKLSDISFKDVVMLNDASTHRPLGFESDVLVNAKPRGRHLIELQTFLSKAHFSRFAMQHMGVVMANDNQAAAVAAIMRDTAMNNGGMVYVIQREGLDLVQRPDQKEEIMDLVWVHPQRTETQSPVIYKHRGTPTIDGLFKSDLMDAPPLEATEDAERTLVALMSVNKPIVVANVLGWMVGAFHKQIYHHIYKQFPLLMLYGQSGAGKTSTQEVFLSLHYYLAKPLVLQADASTPFMIEGAMQSSASIPCVLEEYKPRDMRQGRHVRLKSMLRSAYNSQTYGKGGMAQEPGTTWRDLRQFAFAAPTMFIGEALETETAIVDRTVAIALDKGGLKGRGVHLQWLRDHRHVLSSLGREIVRSTFAIKFDEFRAKMDANMVAAEKAQTRRNNDRPAFNMAVVLTSLDFLSRVLNHTFGATFDERIRDLKATLADTQHEQVVMIPEASKVLNSLALMSHTEDPHAEMGLRPGVDYLLFPLYLDLNMSFCWIKYSYWCKRKGQMPYYDNEAAFMHGLANYSPIMSKASLDSPLRVKGIERVFRFDLGKLAEEGVDPFK